MLNLSIFLHNQVWVDDVLPYALRVRRFHHLDGGRFDGHLLPNSVRLLSHWPRRHREHTFYWQVGTLHLVFTDGTFFDCSMCWICHCSFILYQPIYEQNNLTSRCCQNNPQPLYHRPPGWFHPVLKEPWWQVIAISWTTTTTLTTIGTLSYSDKSQRWKWPKVIKHSSCFHTNPASVIPNP